MRWSVVLAGMAAVQPAWADVPDAQDRVLVSVFVQGVHKAYVMAPGDAVDDAWAALPRKARPRLGRAERLQDLDVHLTLQRDDAGRWHVESRLTPRIAGRSVRPWAVHLTMPADAPVGEAVMGHEVADGFYVDDLAVRIAPWSPSDGVVLSAADVEAAGDAR